MCYQSVDDIKLGGLTTIVDGRLSFTGLYIKEKILYLDFESNCHAIMKLYVKGDLI